MIKSTTALVSLVLLFNLAASPRPALAAPKLAIEVDPATFALGGYSAHVRITPNSLPNWRFGLGVYAMDFPAALVDLNHNNKARGWEVRLQNGVGLFVERTLGPRDRGWLIGGQVALQTYRLGNDHLPGQETEYTNLLLMAHLGYRQGLGTDGLYLQPWFGLGYTETVSGSAVLAEQEYDVAPLVPFLTVHLGYEF